MQRHTAHSGCAPPLSAPLQPACGPWAVPGSILPSCLRTGCPSCLESLAPGPLSPASFTLFRSHFCVTSSGTFPPTTPAGAVSLLPTTSPSVHKVGWQLTSPLSLGVNIGGLGEDEMTRTCSISPRREPHRLGTQVSPCRTQMSSHHRGHPSTPKCMVPILTEEETLLNFKCNIVSSLKQD